MSARALWPAVVGAAGARLTYAALRAAPPGGVARWERTNHRGERITLLEGPAVALGGIAGVLALPAGRRDRAALALAGIGAAVFGGYDDLNGNAASRGFRGHLGALRSGELTTGAVKLAGIGATGVAAALLAAPADQGRAAAAADVVINAGLIAGGANLVNLFDLRPGRAIKAALAAAGLLAVPARDRAVLAAPVAAATALLPDDLGESSMLGDAGANALGALLGTAAAIGLPRRARVATLGAVVGLTVASEYVSFTAVIDRTAPLRWLDQLGRRPVPGSAGPESPGHESPGAASPQPVGLAAEQQDARSSAGDAGGPGPAGPR